MSRVGKKPIDIPSGVKVAVGCGDSSVGVGVDSQAESNSTKMVVNKINFGFIFSLLLAPT